MALNRKHSLIDTSVSNDSTNDLGSVPERRWRRASIAANPLMNKFRPFFNGSSSDDPPVCYNRVRYIRGTCKVFGDLTKTEKDFLNKNVDCDISKAFKEFRSSEAAHGYVSPHGQTGAPSILNSTIEDFIQIHDYMDGKRKELLDRLKKLNEQAKDKQSTIRQTMTELRDSYEKTQRKLETAEANLKKFLTRSDRISIPNYDERHSELEDIRTECESARTLARDQYATETYRIASEEHSITVDFLAKYLFEEHSFYKDIEEHLSLRIPEVQHRLDHDELAPSFNCDLAEHCINRIQRPIAYPIETCIRLLKKSVKEEGLFRIAPSHGKQKKLVAELDLQIISGTSTLQELGYDSHVAASALKQYLRELPDCLLTNALLPQWDEAASLSPDGARIQRIGQLINQLPKVNYDNLRYLVRFLRRVEEHSSENKMTANNLGICIGCSLLYPKEQSLNTPIPSTYTTGSTILELMIIHCEELFQSTNQGDPQGSYRPQPDLIPKSYNSKSRIGSKENLLDIPPTPVLVQPSPGTRQKTRAPPPPSQQISSQMETIIPQQNFDEDIPNEQYPLGQTSDRNSTASNPHTVERRSRRNGDGGTESDRRAITSSLIPQHGQRVANNNNGQEFSSRIEEIEISPTSSDGVNFGKLNHRTGDKIASSPGEITQF